MRFGISLAEPGPGPDPFGQLTDSLKRAVDDGFGSAWMANIFGLDALTAIAVAGSRVPDIELGTAVVPTYPRHPVTMAQQAVTVQAAIGGRLVLGIGLSHKIVIEDMFGYSFEKPARHMREYLAVLLPLLKQGSVSFTGETVKAQIGLTAPREQPVPVLLAALAPQMLKMAGRDADGTVLWMTGPGTIASHIAPLVRAAATEAGKPEPRIVCTLPVCVTDDPDGARDRANKAFAIYGQLPSYRAMLDKEGAGGPGDVAIVGSEDDVVKGIQAVKDAGATDFNGAEFGQGAEAGRTHALLTRLAVEGL